MQIMDEGMVKMDLANNPTQYTAFSGETLLVAGSMREVIAAAKRALEIDSMQPILAFEDCSGRQTDIDLRGESSEAPQVASETPDNGLQARRVGRPKLGVVSREVTLLPRHWEWLGTQPGGVSVTLRKLIDAARKGSADQVAVSQAKEAADRFMLTMLGNQPGYEEASRALYGGDADRFAALTETWPVDLRNYARRLAAPAFATA